MALEGTIKEFGLADIFQLIGLQKKTGVLFLKGTDSTVNIHFEDGMVVKAEDSQMRTKYLLGQIFINRGKINEDQLKEALEIQKSTAQKVGSVLIGQGLVNKDDLRSALEHQMNEIIYKVFRWKGGDYKFYQDKVDYDRDTVIPINFENILMDGVRMMDEWPIIEKKLPSQDIVLKKAEGVQVPEEAEAKGDIFSRFDEEDQSRPGGPSKEATLVLLQVDGRRSVYEIVEYSSLGEFDTCKALVELLDKGYVVKTDSRPGIITEAKPKPEARKERERADLSSLPYAFVAVALILIFLQITGTRRIKGANEKGLEGLKKSFAVSQVKKVADNEVLYYLDMGTMPGSTLDMEQIDYISKEDAVDPWGKQITTGGPSGNIVVTALSAGPDGEMGTADDVSSNP